VNCTAFASTVDLEEELADIAELFPVSKAECLMMDEGRGWTWPHLFELFPESAVTLHRRQRERVCWLRRTMEFQQSCYR